MTSDSNINRSNKARFLTKLSSFITALSALPSDLRGKLLATALLEAAEDEPTTVSSSAWAREVTRFLLYVIMTLALILISAKLTESKACRLYQICSTTFTEKRQTIRCK